MTGSPPTTALGLHYGENNWLYFRSLSFKNNKQDILSKYKQGLNTRKQQPKYFCKAFNFGRLKDYLSVISLKSWAFKNILQTEQRHMEVSV